MILMLHICIALATVAGAVYTAALPTSFRMNGVYGGVAATILSGAALMFLSPAAMVHACLSGSMTVVAVLALQYVAHRRQATATTDAV